MSARRVTPSRIFAGTFRSINTAYSVAVAFAGVPESCASATGAAKQASATATARSAFAPDFRGTPARLCVSPPRAFGLLNSLSDRSACIARSKVGISCGRFLALRQSCRASQLYPWRSQPGDAEFWRAPRPAATLLLPFSGSLANLAVPRLPVAARHGFQKFFGGI